jgi:hypothetical protein
LEAGDPKDASDNVFGKEFKSGSSITAKRACGEWARVQLKKQCPKQEKDKQGKD